jgi:hypothetical protein
MQGLFKVLICQEFNTNDYSLQLWRRNEMKSKKINWKEAAVNYLRL